MVGKLGGGAITPEFEFCLGYLLAVQPVDPQYAHQ